MTIIKVMLAWLLIGEMNYLAIFDSSWVLARASAENFSGGDQWKNQDRKIAPTGLPSFYQ